MAGQQGRKKQAAAGEVGGAKDPTAPAPSLWERLDRPAPAPRAALTPQKIATAAVRIADAEGIDAVTMRRLATELGVAPMAAYRYVSGKGDLLDLMTDAVYAELTVPDELRYWRDVLRANALCTREIMLRHPWLTQISSPQALRALTPHRMAAAERALASLDGLGLGADAMMAVVGTVSSYVHGAVTAECAQYLLMAQEGWTRPDDVRDALAPQMRYLMSTGRYPTYERYLRTATRKDDPQWRFETGLDSVLEGIAARLGI
ncbi:TetR/AcrR family transcriptional regulator C-terminal domain-containing protein [Streptomyces sp. RS10V-4]|uniref:TetR/AcrR family transcriptional regulator C-terminal domain-containing protein n=1 Tax=Streptomyces rhizoryzae TaxID=2932493 RepID=UPI0020041A7A|nr:TetR/AcrR family transcriptional regulator C-terminal domain-containing protein [Streptomyces rhizoryzae]MCK7626073.1 TetR/AcrR family transcriptional regulator C-terminal domain-containing protein [Streptomyces rhizoryzae]